MKKKLTLGDEEFICNNYPKLTLQCLAEKFEVHVSTISRVLGKHNKRKTIVRISGFSEEVRRELRKTLLGLGIADPNFVISGLENKYSIRLRKQNNEIKILDVKEWED